MRHFAEKIRAKTGRAVLVENRIGGAGNIAIEYVGRAKADGYTILIWSGNSVGALMSLLKTPPIDVTKTLQVIATINRQAFMVVVDAKSPYQTLADLTAAMLKKGDKASYATNNHEATIIGEIYKNKTGVQALEISYKTAADSMNDFFSGTVDYAIHNPVLALSQRKQGKMRILGVGSAERFKSIPEVPSMTEQGVPMNVSSWWAATVPAGTPPDVVIQINDWFVEAVGAPDTKAFLENLGGDPFISTPQQAQSLMLEEVDNWREYIKVARIKPLG